MAIKGSLLLMFLILFKERIRKSIVTDSAEKEYDFIIIGGGTTGAAFAGRLSEDPNAKILVLEAGKSDEQYPLIRVPGYEPLLAVDANWDYKTVPQQFAGQSLVDKVERWPRGKVLGGTSSMNHMIYNRGSPHDFDSWEDHGATGWNWENVERYFVKAEGAEDPELSPKLGRTGPVKLSKAYAPEAINDIFQLAAHEIGINSTDYIENLEGFTRLVSSKHRGLRINSIEAYLRDHFPARKNRLHVLCGAYVTKILFDESSNEPEAIGVEFQKGGVKHKAFATKEVILSAGTIGTPQILMLSGIGPEKHLSKFNISVIANVPGVGLNLKDHVRITYHLYSNKIPKLASVSQKELHESVDDFLIEGEGPLTTSMITSFIHYRTPLSGTPVSSSVKKRPFPEIQVAIYPATTRLADVESTYDAQTYKLTDYASEVGKALTQRNGTISNTIMIVGLQHSKSSGSIRLQSSDPFTPPLIDPSFLSNEDDVQVFVEGLKMVERLLDTEIMKKFDVQHVFQPYCQEYGKDRPRNDEYLRCWLRQVAVSEYHPCCTARIGNHSDPNAVVDERLRVRRVRRLRIADASIMPHEMTGNPQGTCYMIAEKAADMIKEDWSY